MNTTTRLQGNKPAKCLYAIYLAEGGALGHDDVKLALAWSCVLEKSLNCPRAADGHDDLFGVDVLQRLHGNVVSGPLWKNMEINTIVQIDQINLNRNNNFLSLFSARRLQFWAALQQSKATYMYNVIKSDTPSSVSNSLMASMTFALSAVKCCLKFSSLSPPEVSSLCRDSCWSASSLLPRDLQDGAATRTTYRCWNLPHLRLLAQIWEMMTKRNRIL